MTAFGVAVDPFRPQDIQAPPGLSEVPPQCPTCVGSVLLYMTQQNPHGDVLFTCLNDGYEAVYRKARDAWEPRPGREIGTWTPPPRTVLMAAAPEEQKTGVELSLSEAAMLPAQELRTEPDRKFTAALSLHPDEIGDDDA